MTILSHFHHHLHHAPSPPLTFYNVSDGPTACFDHHQLRPLPRYHLTDTNKPTNGAPGTANEGQRPCHVCGKSANRTMALPGEDNKREPTAPMPRIWHGHWGIGNTPTIPETTVQTRGDSTHATYVAWVLWNAEQRQRGTTHPGQQTRVSAHVMDW
ncbi:hypothetical protein K443DRAFT_12052 [Laccaria amethystina LaAM-08-1]|uniref:Uncharacterized protein n=1 Tax=Laccaria amethystina LaAM-08-1 TaxID=1095629 RepID=A0A0C9WZU9_9AGAR|nr:hypothetical protein K443DRAFT_12052 [Laccaria amethystina LaAM-08-1]